MYNLGLRSERPRFRSLHSEGSEESFFVRESCPSPQKKKRGDHRPAQKRRSPQNLSSSCTRQNPTNPCPSPVPSTCTRPSASVSEPPFRSVSIVLNPSPYTPLTRSVSPVPSLFPNCP